MNRPVGLLLIALALTVLAIPFVAEAQQGVKTARIGYLSPGAPPQPARPAGPFVQRLRDLGYVVQRSDDPYVKDATIAIEARYAAGKYERLDGLAQELLLRKVDVIVAIGAQSVLAAARATRTVPIVLVNTPDPVKLGVVASLARPGGNVTGAAWDVTSEIVAKQVELVKEVIPKVSRVAMIRNAAAPGLAPYVEAAAAGATRLGLTFDARSAVTPDELERAFAEAVRDRADAVLVFFDAALSQHLKKVVELATRHRLPSMYAWDAPVRAGGLMSYGPSGDELFRQAATFVDKILRGARPADLPVEQPAKFELVINLKTANALGLTIPPTLMLRADKVIE